MRLFRRKQSAEEQPIVSGGGFSPPATYMEWLAAFDRLCSGKFDAEEAGALAFGKLPGGDAVAGMFLRKLAETLETAIKTGTHNFFSELNSCFYDFEEDWIIRCYRRYAARMNALLFFRKLPFIAEKRKKELEKEVLANLESVNDDLFRQLNASQKSLSGAQTHGFDLMVMKMKRIHREYFGENGKLQRNKN